VTVHRRPWLPLLVIAACWLGIASCASGGGGGGGDSAAVKKESYGRQLRSTMADVEQAYGKGVGTKSDTSAELLTRLQTLQLGLRDAANRLDDITPPSSLAAEHRKLVAGVRDMADAIDLRIEAERIAATDPARAKRLARKFATDDSFSRVQAAANAIEQAGVDAGL
jgi:hypothetical protein